jgi:hypothetical protein
MPDTFQALFVVALAVLPGALYTWYFEREAGRWGIGLADRVLRFVGYSAIFQAIYAYPVFWLWSNFLHVPVRVDSQLQFRNLILEGGPLPTWIYFVPAAYVALPISIGTLAGITVNRRGRSAWARALARVFAGRDPAPRAWDNLFSGSPAGVVRVRMDTGGRLGGLFGEDSYAAGYSEQPQDLYLERAYLIQEDGSFAKDADGNFVEWGSGILLKWENIVALEFFPLEAEGL